MATQPVPATPDGDIPRGLGGVLLRAVRGWDRFWFRPADPTTLGLIRLCVGLLVLYVHLVYTLDLQELFGKDAWLGQDAITYLRTQTPIFTPPNGFVPAPPEPLPLPADPAEAKAIQDFKNLWGVDPRQVPAKGNPLFSIWFHLTDPTWMLVVHGLILVVMLLFAVGFCTRVTSVLTWLGALSYIQRAPTTLFGMDAMMSIALLYLMLGPSGAALSIDRLLARWWQRRRAEREQRPVPAWQPPGPSLLANFALRLFQVHFCIIYLASGTSKLQGTAWWNGTALWFTMANYEFSPLDWARYQDLLVFLCQNRWLWELVTSGGVVFTFFVELGFPVLVWPRATRWLMVSAAVLLHVGIALTMGLTTFGLIMLAMLLSFVPAPAVRQLVHALSGGKARAEATPALAA